MRAATSLEPKVPRPLSSPNSLDDLWPEPSSALKSSFPGGLRGKAQGPLIPSCQPCSWLEWLGLHLARRVLRHPPLLSFQSPRRSRALGSAEILPVILEADQLSPNSAARLLPFLFFLEISWCCSPHSGRHPGPG